MKLTIELVPEPCWYSNLRNQMEQSDWDKLRKQTYADYNYRCGICEAKAKLLHCHEIWQYDDKTHIQKLLGFIALCPMCHHVKHIGYAGILAEQGKLDLGKVEEHFMQVNQCTFRAFQKHEDEAWRIWKHRNRYEWTTDLGEYASLVKPPVKQPLIVSHSPSVISTEKKKRDRENCKKEVRKIYNANPNIVRLEDNEGYRWGFCELCGELTDEWWTIQGIKCKCKTCRDREV